MNPVPTISVVVPSYNQGRFLAECLDSIVSQQYPALELIVMDGGSTDQSVDVIRRYEAHLSHWQSGRDGGQSAAINAGVVRACGDLVAWLNSDDLYHDGALWSVARAWSKYPGRGLYIGNGFRLDDKTKLRTRHNPRHMAFSRKALREGLDYVLQPSAFFNRADWNATGGLDERLQFCMDWDILIRIAERNAVVLIDDFLSLSREYDDTKTASGGFRRVDELLRMVKSHTGEEMTIGGSIYAIWTLLSEQMSGSASNTFRHHIHQALLDATRRLSSLDAFRDGSPDFSDPGDSSYLPIPAADAPRQPTAAGVVWPTITVVIPSLNQAAFLERALRSAIDQGYPKLELIVIDGGSTDGSLDIIDRYSDHLAHWESAPNGGPAQAVNRGFSRAKGEVLVWLDADTMMADGALHAAGVAFARDQRLDLLYGDTLLIDARDQPGIVEQGEYKSGLYLGEMQDRNRIPAYWSYRDSVVQSAIYFRRRLLDRSGSLDERYQFAADVELLFRISGQAEIRKIDKVLALQRVIGSAAGERDPLRLTALYAFSRAWWPDRNAEAFRHTRDDFLAAFMDRYWGDRLMGLAFQLRRECFSRIVTDQSANPEEMLACRDTRLAAMRRHSNAKAAAELPARISLAEEPRALEPGVVDLRGRAFGVIAGSGWSPPEPDHVWSLGRSSELRLTSVPHSRGIRFELSGNPHVRGRTQQLDVFVNETRIRTLPLPADERTVVAIDQDAGAWRAAESNLVSFRLDRSSPGGTDVRDLGLCLWSLRVL